jgi:hypothetical protein
MVVKQNTPQSIQKYWHWQNFVNLPISWQFYQYTASRTVDTNTIFEEPMKYVVFGVQRIWGIWPIHYIFRGPKIQSCIHISKAQGEMH